ncbi:MAG: acyltransferase [Nitrococcus sp.]|nr:acyltransferase [Nitrococcus sp.]
MQSLTRYYWRLRGKIRMLALWMVDGIPGRTGFRLRYALMRQLLKHLGEGTVLKRHLQIDIPETVSIGSHCALAQGTFIGGGGGVTIGDWVAFGPDVKVWSANHRFDDPDRPCLLQGDDDNPVIIENDVWLGANVFVAPGVTIGKGAIVAAGAVVNKSIPPYAQVAGNPGRVVGWRKKPSALSQADSDGAKGIVGDIAVKGTAYEPRP